MKSKQISIYAGQLKVNADYSKLNTPERREKAEKVFFEIAEVCNSEYFKNCFLEEMKDIHGELSPYRDFNPMALYIYFMSGAEVLSPEKDSEMDIVVDDFWSWKWVIGYTNRNDPTIHVNTRYFDKLSTKAAGSNLVHEFLHKLGFEHDFKRTARRPFSVCYKGNNAYERAYDLVYPDSVVEVKQTRAPLWKRVLFFWRVL